MNICLISKYPPIEGGESSKAYWLAKGLGKKGVNIHLVTNSWEVEENYKEKIQPADLVEYYQPENVRIYNTSPFIDPYHIPYHKPYTEKLIGLALNILELYDIDVIDSWYFLPYVIVGYFLKLISSKPQIIRHGGSDIGRIINQPYFYALTKKIIQEADQIITYESTRNVFEKLGSNKNSIYINAFSVDSSYFNPNVKTVDLGIEYEKHKGKPILTFIGKTERSKGLYDFIDAARLCKNEFVLLFIINNDGVDVIKRYLEQLGLISESIIKAFVPPWEIPSYIKISRAVVIPENNFPIKQHMPILIREVMAIGVCLIVSYELYSKLNQERVKNNKNLLVVDPKDKCGFVKTLDRVIKEPALARQIGMRGYEYSKKIENFDLYIEKTIEMYENVKALNYR